MIESAYIAPRIALARLEHHPHGGVWIVESCPYCARPHVHGGGGASDDPRDFLGHRDAACRPSDLLPNMDNSPGYILSEAP